MTHRRGEVTWPDGWMGALIVDLAVGVICLPGTIGFKKMIKEDDALDVFGVRAVGGIFDGLTTGIVNSPNCGGPGTVIG